MAKIPQATKEQILAIAQVQWDKTYPSTSLPTHFIFAVRGYWPQTMGPTKGNDPGIFDDAWFFISPTSFLAIPANTDPSRYGWNSGVRKPMAVLNTGFWPFFRGAHKGLKPALRQFTREEGKNAGVPKYGAFSVTRTFSHQNFRNYQETGYFAINCHSGGISNTSSEGCQTASSLFYHKFMAQVWKETQDANVDVIYYGLINGRF